MILRIVVQIMPPPNYPNHLFTASGWGSSDFLYYRPLTPTIRCYSGLRAFFTSDLWIVLQIMPPPKLPEPSGAVHSIWWLGFFFDLFSYSGLRAFFTSDLTNCTTDYAHPPKEPKPSGAVLRIWWLGFFLTSFPILDLEHFSQVILWIVLQIMPPQITPTIRCCSQHLMVGFFFRPLLLFWT